MANILIAGKINYFLQASRKTVYSNVIIPKVRSVVGVFIIEDRTGEIYTQESPSGPNRYELIVQATDTGGLSDETTVIVIVEQRGGRAPEGPVIEWPKNDIKNAILVSEVTHPT